MAPSKIVKWTKFAFQELQMHCCYICPSQGHCPALRHLIAEAVWDPTLHPKVLPLTYTMIEREKGLRREGQMMVQFLAAKSDLP